MRIKAWPILDKKEYAVYRVVSKGIIGDRLALKMP